MPRHHDKAPEKAAVAKVGRRHPEVARTLEGHSQVLFAEPNAAAPRRTDADPERVLLGVYDYEHDRSVLAVVDTARETVLSVDETTAQFQLTDEERLEAEQMAAADPQIRRFLAGRQMNPLTRLYFPAGSEREPGHRHAIVFVRPTKSERRYAVVDLSARRVIGTFDRRQLAGE